MNLKYLDRMRHIEDIEKMTLSELEDIADDKSIKVPDTMASDIESAIIAEVSVMDGKAHHRSRKYMPFAVAAISAAACIAVLVGMPKEPEDTFDDPRMAYAELEKTFSYISSKMDKGLDIASEADPIIEKTTNVFKKK